MATVENKQVRVFRELASSFAQQGQDQLRDRFLVLAADAAREFNRADEAEVLRQRLLEHNPHHLLKPFASFEEAMQSEDVRSYVEGLRKKYPFDDSEQLLAEMHSGEPKFGPSEPKHHDDIPDFGATPPREEAAVFRFQEETESPIPPPLPQATAELRETIPFREESPLDQPSIQPSPFAQPEREPRPLVPAPLPEPEEAADDELTAGSWLVTTLLVLVILAGVGLAFYTLARPFLPELLALVVPGS